AALQSIARKSRVFEGFIGHFEEQALLRIHLQRLARSDAEEAGVEAIHRIEKAAPTRGHLAWCRRVGVEETPPVPSIGWHFANRIGTRREHAPVRLRITRPARESAAHSDNGDRL